MVSKSISSVNDYRIKDMGRTFSTSKPGSENKYHHETVPHIFHMLLLLHDCQYHDRH